MPNEIPSDVAGTSLEESNTPDLTGTKWEGIGGGAVKGATTGMMFGPWGALIGGLFGAGAAAFGDSPQEQSMEEIMKALKDAEEYLKSTPFTKDEVMNQLLPQAQKIYRGAADVVAGKAGAAVGEAGVAKGQAFAEYYTQALAPIIGKGEEQAGDAISRFGKWFSDMDAQGKNRFIATMQTLMGGTAGLSGMSDTQKGIVGGLEGARIGGGIGGDFDILGELQKLMEAKQGFGKSATNFGNVNTAGG